MHPHIHVNRVDMSWPYWVLSQYGSMRIRLCLSSQHSLALLIPDCNSEVEIEIQQSLQVQMYRPMIRSDSPIFMGRLMQFKRLLHALRG